MEVDPIHYLMYFAKFDAIVDKCGDISLWH